MPQPVTSSRLPKVFWLLFFVLFLSACAGVPLQYPALAENSEPFNQPVELHDTPFHPQEAYQCGPAALATVLQYSGVEQANPEALADQVYLPDRRGSLQLELLGAARRADRIPYVLAPSLADLLTEVKAGHPVLVLQNLGLRRWPQWHYAVVIGFDIEQESIILRSGTTEREQLSLRRFEHTWQLADYWALVVAEPGNTPATAEELKYLAAVAAVENQQRLHIAQQGYEAARQRWPDNATSYLGLGNIAYQQQDYAAAEQHYLAAAALKPEQASIYYNLAWAFLRQGKFSKAQQAAQEAEILAPEHERYGNAVATVEAAISDG
ncbi:hypothetical protein CWE09_04860 [Aliidiomarina minuta]|uniref:Peptidase C39-like domain-containing protein n=1 Tax=Aliidiomarina minuta TaxID=880057 RepID=A0A432W7T2_9GAMM|nr:PA2778 family cysteine peptidase [Aliidiomarina minuta]RUO26061.1 hypothetical protein CWE09_04860 [Aliidiomarina minuta]